MKEFQNNELKKSWEASIQKKKELENFRKSIKDIDPAKIGLSSMVTFSGDDANREERLRLQKEQMKRWTQEQVYEKAYQKKLEKDEDLAQAEINRAVDAIREATEREEWELSRYSRLTVAQQNAEVSKNKPFY